MARLTSEKAAAQVGLYELVLIASRRARELKRGWRPLVQCSNDIPVTAIREIEQGLIGKDYLFKSRTLDRREKPPTEQDAE